MLLHAGALDQFNSMEVGQHKLQQSRWGLRLIMGKAFIYAELDDKEVLQYSFEPCEY